MATIGQALTAPEAGWQRYDDKDSRIICKNMSDGSTSSAYNGSRKMGNDINSNVTFTFYGTKLRIISVVIGSASTSIPIKIDGVVEYFSEKSSTQQEQTLVYEKLGLNLDYHTVIISGSSLGFIFFDAIDIDNTGFLCGVTGFSLTNPESGWKRYNDTDSRIIYTGSEWSITNDVSTYNTSYHLVTNGNNTILTFKFYGTKLRLIGAKYTRGRSANISVSIDNIYISSFSQIGITTYQSLDFEKIGLALGIHTVVITIPSLNYCFDAIDIDATGYLLHPTLNQVQDINSMQVGDCIPCKYTATTSGQVGYFSELGTCIANEIPLTGTATPDGLFYFIKTNIGLLIADRVIQINISWDTLNASKYIQGKQVVLQTKNIFIRSLSGGVAYLDSNGNPSTTDQNLGAWPPNNEWDKYIVKSDFNGKIVKGDDNIWHWSNKWSWVTNTPSNGVVTPTTALGNNTIRIIRPYLTNNRFDSGDSGNSNTYGGFRPALNYLESNIKATTLFY